MYLGAIWTDLEDQGHVSKIKVARLKNVIIEYFACFKSYGSRSKVSEGH